VSRKGGVMKTIRLVMDSALDVRGYGSDGQVSELPRQTNILL